jgi:hypothetical protein
VDNQLTERFDDSQGISPQREIIATISLFFAGENRRYTASRSPALQSRSEGRRGDSSEAMMVVDTGRVLVHCTKVRNEYDNLDITRKKKSEKNHELRPIRSTAVPERKLRS